MFADGVGNLNWVSRYLGKNVYSPAIGKMWRTLLAVLNMSMSFFSRRLTVLGKSAIATQKFQLLVILY